MGLWWPGHVGGCSLEVAAVLRWLPELRWLPLGCGDREAVAAAARLWGQTGISSCGA